MQHCHWPLSRLEAATEYYINELASVQAVHNDQIINPPISHMRLRLGDFIGRSIRFYLRRFFNPVPVSLHTYSEREQPDYDFSRSSVHTLIAMSDENGKRDTAVADGSISSVISLALYYMNEFFELNETLKAIRSSDSKYINCFCRSLVSKRGLENKGSTIILNNDDLNQILSDLDECHISLAGVRACKFFHSVMKWPGVSKAIDKAGGWAKVEEFANLFHEFALHTEVPHDRHFSLLGNVRKLVKRIDNDLDELCQVEEECDKALRRMWKRFRCGTKSKELLQANQGIKVIRKHLQAGGESIFPSIVPFEEEE